MDKSLDLKLDKIRNGNYQNTDFIIADAKDGDMGGGVFATGSMLDNPEKTKPYKAYLQAMRLDQLPDDVSLVCKPTLFAGYLNHWGHLGPAEIEPKKVFIFRQCAWRARRMGVDFNLPPNHPFNPLRALRLAEALDGDLKAVQVIFRSVWVDGLSLIHI